jgi:hypothetical protein
LAQTVSCPPLSAEAPMRSLSVNMRFLVDKVALGQVLLPVLRFSLKSVSPPIILTHLHLRIAKSRNIPKSNALLKIGEFWPESIVTEPSNGKVTINKQTRDTVANSEQLRLVDRFVRRVTADC